MSHEDQPQHHSESHAGQELELFVHVQDKKPKVIAARPGETLREVLVRFEIIKQEQNDILVFIGECEEALAEPDEIEEGEDQHAPVDINLSLQVLELQRHRHVHCHHCRHIAVAVNYNGETKKRKFSPATTIGVVAQWARKKFHLDAAAAGDFVLRLCKSSSQPRPSQHLGEVASDSTCSVCFDLAKEATPQG